MIKYVKLGLVLALSFLSCKMKQERVAIDDYSVTILLYTNEQGAKYAFRPICKGRVTNRGTDFVYNVRVHVEFSPYIKSATDRPYANYTFKDTLQPAESDSFEVYGGKADCLPDYEIPDIIVLTIRTSYRYPGGCVL